MLLLLQYCCCSILFFLYFFCCLMLLLLQYCSRSIVYVAPTLLLLQCCCSNVATMLLLLQRCCGSNIATVEGAAEERETSELYETAEIQGMTETSCINMDTDSNSAAAWGFTLPTQGEDSNDTESRIDTGYTTSTVSSIQPSALQVWRYRVFHI